MYVRPVFPDHTIPEQIIVCCVPTAPSAAHMQPLFANYALISVQVYRAQIRLTIVHATKDMNGQAKAALDAR